MPRKRVGRPTEKKERADLRSAFHGCIRYQRRERPVEGRECGARKRESGTQGEALRSCIEVERLRALEQRTNDLTKENAQLEGELVQWRARAEHAEINSKQEVA